MDRARQIEQMIEMGSMHETQQRKYKAIHEGTYQVGFAYA
jgi:hypothetical protein